MAYSISRDALHRRIHRGFTPEEAVAYPGTVAYHEPIRLRDGRWFPNKALLAEALDVHPTNISQKYKSGWSYDQIAGLDAPPDNLLALAFPMTFEGHTYASLIELARAFGVRYQTVAHRLRKEWTVRQAVGLDASPDTITYDGVDYPNVRAFVTAFRDKGGIRNQTLVGKRLRRLHWTPGQAIGLEPPPVAVDAAAKQPPAKREPFCYIDGVPHAFQTDVVAAFDIDRYRLRRGLRANMPLADILGIAPERVVRPIRPARAVSDTQYKRRIANGFSPEDARRIPSHVKCTAPIRFAGIVYGSLRHIEDVFGQAENTVHDRKNRDRMLCLLSKYPPAEPFDWNETDAIAHAVRTGRDRQDVLRKLRGGLTYDQATSDDPPPVIIHYDERDFYTLEAFSTYVGHPVTAMRRFLRTAPGMTLEPRWFAGKTLPDEPRWFTSETSRNETTTATPASGYTVNGVTYRDLEDAARKLGCDAQTVKRHLYGGASREQAFGHQPLPEPLATTSDIPFYTLDALLAHTGVERHTYARRRSDGLSLEHALNLVPPWGDD